MPFVNEFIQPEDRLHYDLVENMVIRHTGPAGHIPARHWTIDRERGMYLTQIKQGGEEAPRFSAFLFYWQGHIFYIKTWLLSSCGGGGVPRTNTFRLDFLGEVPREGQHPKLNAPFRNLQFVADLQDAFNARKEAGIHTLETNPYHAVLKLTPSLVE